MAILKAKHEGKSGEFVIYRNLGGFSYRFNSCKSEHGTVIIQIGGIFEDEIDAMIHFEENYGEIVKTPASYIMDCHKRLVEALSNKHPSPPID